MISWKLVGTPTLELLPKLHKNTSPNYFGFGFNPNLYLSLKKTLSQPSVLFHRSVPSFSPYHQPSLALADLKHPRCEWSLPIHPGGSINRHRWCHGPQNWSKCWSEQQKMFQTNYLHHFLFVMRSSFMIFAISSSLPFQMCLSLLRGPCSKQILKGRLKLCACVCR